MKEKVLVAVILLFWAHFPIHSQTFCENKKAVSLPGKSESYTYKEFSNQKGKSEALHIQFEYPADDLPVKKRPLIIGLHGSGFINTCLSDPCHLKYSRNVLSKNFVSKGFITASIEYRLLSPFSLNPFNLKDEKLKDAQYKAVQDAREAIRYVFANAEKLGVDTENVFVIGTSAGAITALNAAFMDNEEVPADLLNKYGKLVKREKIKGVISLSGAIYDLGYLDGGDKIPLMIVHGTKDFIVPIDEGFYLKIKHLTSVFGGRRIFEQAQSKGIPAKGFFYDFGHAYPDEMLSEIFENANDFIRSNLTCPAKK